MTTDRTIAAAHDSSPFYYHEPQTWPEKANVTNHPNLSREFSKAIFESLTTEELLLVGKMAGSIHLLLENFTLEELLNGVKLLFAIGKAYNQPGLEKVEDGRKAYDEGWERMRHYRTTGEP